ncbi:Cobalamin (vitamin B12)-binding domain protein [Acididesulfobacillus acetoxydans]|uniref:Cobalamin (Vitamin B12)-binding domain protein n=1 Tax=Acididesulfobacillus acetoxydans TaxID=1561005 RepID=A0A8S0W2A8_9FIRM|nr:Cobalamin (vitamin B12)-binding domain protein [Acididesulfobacillus acetoxydans]CEJ06692.1 Dimethylamine corrinoid protein 1 [Acididesulfobacillus acetoxydans]
MDFKGMNEHVLKGNVEEVTRGTQEMLESGAEPLRIISEGLIPGMNVVGGLFKKGEMFVPEVMRSAKAMSAGIALVRPLIADSDIPTRGTVLMGTVRGDLHDIGKNLVSMMLESQGFTVIDLGVNITPEQFVAAAEKHRPQIIGMSALLTTTMLAMRETIKALQEVNLTDGIKVMIGGAPVTAAFAKEIGADGYAPDAGSAVELCEQFVA